ncbi:HCP-like protein [Daldinia caldariorum]|uniref:HCP-like protein n=1 Tax=Daldinia caldariorum TaxID=326644 RepID=UPI0020082994|nr:HCP-like protein [Daldinia caldariorum]KAI1464009.1 HCP-like protein [Daldinia caldariorum]
MRRWLVSALLLLQVVAFTSAADQQILGDDTTTENHPQAAETDVVQREQHTWAPYQSGWELVHEAMTEFRKIKIHSSHRKTKKPTSVFGILFHYLPKILPSLRVSAPPQEHAQPVISGPLLEGVKLLQQSAEQNNTDAIYLLAQFNFFGNYSHPRNFKTAFDHYYRLASYGNSSAQYMVGLMYATGLGDAVERDQAKALLYHTFAADAGHTRSEMTLAARHVSGVGVPKSCEMACKYYKRVADKAMEWFRSGPPGGMALTPEAHRLSDDVGGVYGEGASVVSSGINALKADPSSHAYAAIDDVIEYLDLMSQKGDFKASFNLGRLYYEGQRGLERNVDLARRYFAAVTTMYWRTKDGRPVDQPKPQLEKYASKAAGYIGRMWLRGEGVRQDFKLAKGWFERGIKHGDAQSQWGLGIMNLHGLGIPKNVSKATELFKASADQDFSLSHVALGALHLDQGTPDDLKIANSYFEAAVRWANIEAQYYLAEMMHHGVGRDKTCGMAMAYYKSVAERAEPLVSSWTEANQAYEDGDYELAFLDYLIAAEQGYEKAQNNVAFMLDPSQSRLPLPSWLHRQPAKPSLLQNSALALIYWTRSAIQSNIDSLVKMGDYYLDGIGTEPAFDKAAQCYTGASEYFQSAQALYNLGWMHENGVGLTQDFHLAKRYYDQALEANEEAYLPVTLSLLKLRARSAWNTFTHGRINSIQDEPSPRKDWSLSEWISNFLQEDVYYEEGYEAFDEGMITGSDGEPLNDGLEDVDAVVESLIILGLVGAIAILMYYRARRQQAHVQAEAEAARQGQQGGAGVQQQQQQPGLGHQGGVFPQPGAPDFRQWAAGAVGH